MTPTPINPSPVFPFADSNNFTLKIGKNSMKLKHDMKEILPRAPVNHTDRAGSISSILRFSFYATSVISLLVLFLVHAVPLLFPIIHPNSKNECVFVPGAGFSGFWFKLGQLESIPDPLSKEYYCYSSGCLGVAAMLSNHSYQEIFEMASETQRLWQEGVTSRYDVVQEFVDRMLPPLSTTLDISGINFTEDFIPLGYESGGKIDAITAALSNFKIITTRLKGTMGIERKIQTPQTIEELREYLIHTTWIPYITGSSLWIENSHSFGEYYIDGAFSTSGFSMNSNVCMHHLSTPFAFDIVLDSFNIGLGWDRVEKYWNNGASFGLEL